MHFTHSKDCDGRGHRRVDVTQPEKDHSAFASLWNAQS
jgi:hypothetical protein